MRSHVITGMIAFIVAISLASSSVQCKPTRIQACGKDLADILQHTCHSQYYSYLYHPSNGDGRGSPNKRGISQECCSHSCTYNDILQYCSGTPVNNETDEFPPVAKSESKNIECRHKSTESINNEIVPEIEVKANPCDPNMANAMPPLPPKPDPDVPNKSSTPQQPSTSVMPPPDMFTTKPYYRKAPAIVILIANKFNMTAAN